MNPKIKIVLNKGRVGVPLDKLSGIAKDTCKFLTSLGQDLNSDRNIWIAYNFENGSMMCDLANPDIPPSAEDDWTRGFRCIMSGSVVDEEMNLRIRRETRNDYYNIARRIDADEFIEFSIYNEGIISSQDTFKLDRSLLAEFEEERPSEYRYHGEIQGVVHAFFKEAKKPKLSIRDLSTHELVDCFFTKDMYQVAVDLLRDEDAIIFVEGMISEDANTGIVREIDVTEFTPAPKFDLAEFESMIGAFPKVFTGGKDICELLDDFRDT